MNTKTLPLIDTHTELCAVIGNPIEHSLSPAMHNAAYRAIGMNAVYLAFHITDVAGCLGGMRAIPSFRGMSVTIPHKRAVMEYLDSIEPMALHVGSVNTITREDGCLIGSTTDGPGTIRAFDDAGISLEGKRVLFTGSGGAVRAVVFAFAELTDAAQLTILGRTPKHVEELVSDLRERTDASVAGGELVHDIESAMAEHDIIIQGTPIGMHPHPDATCVPAEFIRSDHIVFDMVYRPYTTRLLEDALTRGCTVIHGTEMLLNQAVLQFERWFDVPAPREAMNTALLSSLSVPPSK